MQALHSAATGRGVMRPTSRPSIAQDDLHGLSPAAAAAVIGCGKTTIFKVLASGELKSHKLGRKRLIVFADLRAWIASLSRQP